MYGQTVNTSDADSGSSAAATSTGAIAGWRLVLPIGWRGIFAIPSCWSLKGVHTRRSMRRSRSSIRRRWSSCSATRKWVSR